MEERYKVYNETMDQIEEMEKSGEIFVIRPSRDPQIGRMEKNPEKVKAVYDLGYKDACAQMEALKAWLWFPYFLNICMALNGYMNFKKNFIVFSQGSFTIGS